MSSLVTLYHPKAPVEGRWEYCPVCCERKRYLKNRSDQEGLLLEMTEACHECGLYNWSIIYGNGRWMIGWVSCEWNDVEEPKEFEARRALERAALEEARRLWDTRNDHDQNWIERTRNWMYGDADWLVFADWLDEHGFPLNAEYLRRE